MFLVVGGEQEVSFLGRDALIRNKTASDRDVDRVDVKKLRAIFERERRR